MLSVGFMLAAALVLGSGLPLHCASPDADGKDGAAAAPADPAAATRNGAFDLARSLRNLTAANPCNELDERTTFFELAGLRDAADQVVTPGEHYVETFRGRAVPCKPHPFGRARYDAMIAAYRAAADAALTKGPSVPPLVLWIHGGLVAGPSGFGSAHNRTCDFFLPAACSNIPVASVPQKLNGFPVFVVWHTGLTEALVGTIFASRTRETSAHGVVSRIAHRSRAEQDLFDRCVTHDDRSGFVNGQELRTKHNLNHAETLFRTYNYLSAPNAWRFYQDEIADTFALPADDALGTQRIVESDRTGLWLVQSIADLRAWYGDKFRVVIVGHSMGAEYGSWLIETYDRYIRDTHRDGTLEPVPMKFDVIFMAPAVPYTTFERALRTNRIANFRMFTMEDSAERKDHLTQFGVFRGDENIYPLSLLYFISGVLNPYPDYPLLGMHRYIRDKRYREDAAMKNPVIADVQANLDRYKPYYALSPSVPGTAPGLQTCAIRHGDFDGDAQTTQSIKYIINTEWDPLIRSGKATPALGTVPPPQTAGCDVLRAASASPSPSPSP